ncbi:hypothetical protein [Phormidesmis priestleyi]|uniref:hypothetical protein n=1 Tax=Phormidesmis priestleyi TaxID=268141 RepID=UPI00083A41FF|nr:hypothetical protein [Phormidesmis priestleyi]
MDFVVVDTEGNPELSEIAVLDRQGHLVYEAFAAEHTANLDRQHPLKSLKEIAQDIHHLAQNLIR